MKNIIEKNKSEILAVLEQMERTRKYKIISDSCKEYRSYVDALQRLVYMLVNNENIYVLKETGGLSHEKNCMGHHVVEDYDYFFLKSLIEIIEKEHDAIYKLMQSQRNNSLTYHNCIIIFEKLSEMCNEINEPIQYYQRYIDRKNKYS